MNVERYINLVMLNIENNKVNCFFDTKNNCNAQMIKFFKLQIDIHYFNTQYVVYCKII